MLILCIFGERRAYYLRNVGSMRREINVMLYLAIGMIISGIMGRVTLLSVRSGTFEGDQAVKPILRVLVDLLGTLAGLSAFVISFFLFAWWIPLLCGAVGYWLTAPFLVNANTFGIYYRMQGVLTLASTGCSVMLLNMYFNFF